MAFGVSRFGEKNRTWNGRLDPNDGVKITITATPLRTSASAHSAIDNGYTEQLPIHDDRTTHRASYKAPDYMSRLLQSRGSQFGNQSWNKEKLWSMQQPRTGETYKGRLVHPALAAAMLKTKLANGEVDLEYVLPAECLAPQGRIRQPHLRTMLAQLGIYLSDSDFLKLWNRYDSRHIGAIPTTMFLQDVSIAPAKLPGQLRYGEIDIPVPVQVRPGATREISLYPVTSTTHSTSVVKSSTHQTTSRNTPALESRPTSRLCLTPSLPSANEKLIDGLLTGFHLFDFNNDGFVSRKDFSRVLSEFGVHSVSVDIDRLLSGTGGRLTRNGRVNYKEFLRSHLDSLLNDNQKLTAQTPHTVRQTVPRLVGSKSPTPWNNRYNVYSSNTPVSTLGCEHCDHTMMELNHQPHLTDGLMEVTHRDKCVHENLVETRTRHVINGVNMDDTDTRLVLDTASVPLQPVGGRSVRLRKEAWPGGSMKTVTWRDKNPGRGSSFEEYIYSLLRKIKNQVMNQWSYLITYFQTRDRIGQNHIGKAEMKTLMERLYLNLSSVEREDLCDVFDLYGNRRFHYNAFMESMASA